MDDKSLSVKKILKKSGCIIHDTHGISMLPLLEEGKDTVFLKSLSKTKSELKTGDVVLYERNRNIFVLHRIIGISEKKYIICGDNCVSSEKVPKRKIIAVMTGFYKGTEYHSADEENYRGYVSKILSEKPENRRVIHPMSKKWMQVFHILKKAVTGSDSGCDFENADWNGIYFLAKSHSIAATLAGTVKEYGCPDEIYQKFNTSYLKNIERGFLFQAERTKLIKELEKNKIKYILLKGLVISKMYPKEGMREFADNDFLLPQNTDFNSVGKIMKSNGYKEKKEPVHNTYCKPPYYNFEFHKSLFADWHEFGHHFDKVFDTAKKISEFEYALNDDDFYCYIYAHAFKHFSKGGVGLRTISDIYLINKYYSERKIVINKSLLIKNGLSDFERKMTEIAEKLFENTDTLTYDDISYIMTSGTYGSASHSIDKEIMRHGKFGFFVKRIFPDFSNMAERFPILRKLPFLMPLFWIIRLLISLFDERCRKYLSLLFKKCFKKK